jgi:putative ATP-binding cassette transporter
MPHQRMPPFLLGFGNDLRKLAAAFLLPVARRRAWLRASGQILAAAVLALGATTMLVAAIALGIDQLVGTARRQLIFPYLGPLLTWAQQGPHLPLAVLVALLGLFAITLLGRGLSPILRRRWLALAALLTLLVVSTAVDVAFTEGNGAVMDALNQKNADAFWGTAIGLMAIYLLTLPIQFLNTYGQQRWALAWRRSSTADLIKGSLGNQSYYHLQADPALSERIDNPDQRIADDVQLAVSSATTLFFGFCASLLSLGAYILVLFSISGTLVLSLAVATLLGNGVIVPLVRRLGQLGIRQQALEADYRFALVHIRSHAESLAFLRGERPVAQGLVRRFQALLANFERLIRWRTVVEQSSGLYAFLMQFIPYLVLSAAYFGSKVSLGDLTVGSLAFAQVQASLSFLIDRAEAVSGLFASLHRIGDLDSVLAAAKEAGLSTAPAFFLASATPASAPAPASASALRSESSTALTVAALADPSPLVVPLQGLDASAGVAPAAPLAPEAVGLRLCDLGVVHPGLGRLLLQGLDLNLTVGQRLLITGPSGSGKTSLLRVLCGLTQPASGRLERPGPDQTLVLPQQPFLPLGSLRDQLLFPGQTGSADVSDQALRQLMDRVGLADLAGRHADLGVEDDWGRVLSGGEQQRLGFARLLLRRPGLAILDEASSALDLAAEASLYALLVQAGPTVVSVGHRPSLRAFHHTELQLDGQGGWRLIPIAALVDQPSVGPELKV